MISQDVITIRPAAKQDITTSDSVATAVAVDNAVTDIKGHFIGLIGSEFSHTTANTKSSSSSSIINANKDTFLTEYLCKAVADYGKAAVMAMSNNGTAPKFSKYSGVVEWHNAVYLWVNIGGKTGYHNAFTEEGRFMMWYGGSRMHAGV